MMVDRGSDQVGGHAGASATAAGSREAALAASRSVSVGIVAALEESARVGWGQAWSGTQC